MDAAGPSMGRATSGKSTPQLSPKKSPKKHPNRTVTFRQNSNNSSPKRSIGDPSPLNLQNGPLSAPLSTLPNQLISPPILTYKPSTSASISHQGPFPTRLSKVDPFSAAIESVCQNKSTPKISQENSAPEYPEVHSLMITVHNNAVPFERFVQNDVQPERGVPNDAIQMAGDVTPGIPHPSMFPEYDSLTRKQHRQHVSAFVERRQAKKTEKLNGVQTQKIIENNVQQQMIIQKDVLSQRIVKNDVQPQRSVRKNANQAEGIEGNGPGRSYQPRFPQSQRCQYNLPHRGDRRPPDHSNPEPYSEQAYMEASTQVLLNHRQRKLYQQDPNYHKKVVVSGKKRFFRP